MSIGMMITRRNTRIAAIYAVMIALILGCLSQPRVERVPDVNHVHLTEAGPLSIHVVTFDLTRDDLAVLATVGTGVNGCAPMLSCRRAYARYVPPATRRCSPAPLW